MSETLSDIVYVRRGFLPPSEMLAILGALDSLSSRWTPSEELRALGRGRTDQVRSSDIVVRSALDQVRQLLAPRVLEWATACGFGFAATPHLQLFPVRMSGDPQMPAYQVPHRDSHAQQPYPPTCTTVFYAKAQGVVGGDLAVSPTDDPDASDPVVIQPAINMVASFRGDRVHWVQPLYAGERLSIVVNFY